jgi:hypothetical protein
MLDRLAVHVADVQRAVGRLGQARGSKPVVRGGEELAAPELFRPTSGKNRPARLEQFPVDEVASDVPDERVAAVLGRKRVTPVDEDSRRRGEEPDGHELGRRETRPLGRRGAPSRATRRQGSAASARNTGAAAPSSAMSIVAVGPAKTRCGPGSGSRATRRTWFELPHTKRFPSRRRTSRTARRPSPAREARTRRAIARREADVAPAKRDRRRACASVTSPFVPVATQMWLSSPSAAC